MYLSLFTKFLQILYFVIMFKSFFKSVSAPLHGLGDIWLVSYLLEFGERKSEFAWWIKSHFIKTNHLSYVLSCCQCFLQIWLCHIDVWNNALLLIIIWEYSLLQMRHVIIEHSSTRLNNLSVQRRIRWRVKDVPFIICVNGWIEIFLFFDNF